MSKTWFITGAGRGFGREFAKAALDRCDRVAATARNTEALGDLVVSYGDAVLPLALDVADREKVFAAVKRADETFGSLDVVVNNAGYGLFGAVEEITPEQLRHGPEPCLTISRSRKLFSLSVAASRTTPHTSDRRSLRCQTRPSRRCASSSVLRASNLSSRSTRSG
jgi:NAD(P)-dependent dehydrogenase (short-subunit alcohol dehydrogenase family)